MKKMQCEICGSTNFKKIDEKTFECQECGVQYDCSKIEPLEEVAAPPSTESSKPKIAVNLDALSDKLDQLLEQENVDTASAEELPLQTDEEAPVKSDEKDDLDATDAVDDFSNNSESPAITDNESEAFDAKEDETPCASPNNAVDSDESSKSSKKFIIPSVIGLLILIVPLVVFLTRQKEAPYDANADFIPSTSTISIPDETITNSTTSNYTTSEMISSSTSAVSGVTSTASKPADTTSKTTSTASKITSTTSKITSTTSKAASTTSKVTSTTSKVTSTTSKVTSTTSKVTSTTSKITSTTSKVTSTESQTTDTTSKTTSTTSDITTTTSEPTENEEIHIHEYSEATCTKNPTCSCGDTLPWLAEHDWEEPTCETPFTCRVCGAQEGVAWGHDWEEATCETPKKCNKCGKIEGSAIGHDYENDDNVLVCRKCKNFSPNAESVIKAATIERLVPEDTRASIDSAEISSIKYYRGDSYEITLVVRGNLNFTGTLIKVSAYGNSGDLIDSNSTYTNAYGNGEYYVSVEVPIDCAPSKYVIQI